MSYFSQRLESLKKEFISNTVYNNRAVLPGNGIFERYEMPVLTSKYIPLEWKYDLNEKTNPFLMERLGVNAVLNPGAIYLNGKYYLVARVEGNDRKSFFAVAESDNGIDGFKFWDLPCEIPATDDPETNVYDMRLVKHEDGYIYGLFCAERKDPNENGPCIWFILSGELNENDNSVFNGPTDAFFQRPHEISRFTAKTQVRMYRASSAL